MCSAIVIVFLEFRPQINSPLTWHFAHRFPPVGLPRFPLGTIGFQLLPRGSLQRASQELLMEPMFWASDPNQESLDMVFFPSGPSSGPGPGHYYIPGRAYVGSLGPMLGGQGLFTVPLLTCTSSGSAVQGHQNHNIDRLRTRRLPGRLFLIPGVSRWTPEWVSTHGGEEFAAKSPGPCTHLYIYIPFCKVMQRKMRRWTRINSLSSRINMRSAIGPASPRAA